MNSAPKRTLRDGGLKKMNEPRSKKEHRYIRVRMGINIRSIFLHNFLSCSGVSVGGGGNDESPPKSTNPWDFFSRSALEVVSSTCSEEGRFSILPWSEEFFFSSTSVEAAMIQIQVSVMARDGLGTAGLKEKS